MGRAGLERSTCGTDNLRINIETISNSTLSTLSKSTLSTTMKTTNCQSLKSDQRSKTVGVKIGTENETNTSRNKTRESDQEPVHCENEAGTINGKTIKTICKTRAMSKNINHNINLNKNIFSENNEQTTMSGLPGVLTAKEKANKKGVRKSGMIFTCTTVGCNKILTSEGGIKSHVKREHSNQHPKVDESYTISEAIGQPDDHSTQQDTETLLTEELTEEEEEVEAEVEEEDMNVSENLLDNKDGEKINKENDGTQWSTSSASFLDNMDLSNISKIENKTKQTEKNKRKNENTDDEEDNESKKAKLMTSLDSQADMFDSDESVIHFMHNNEDGMLEIAQLVRTQKTKILEAESEVQELNEANEKLEGELKKAEATWEETEKAYMNQLDKAKKETQEQKKLMERIEEERKTPKDKQIIDLQKQNQSLVARIKTLGKEKDTLQGSVDKLKSTNETVTGDRDTKAQLIANLEKQIARLEGDYKKTLAQVPCTKKGCRGGFNSGCGKNHDARLKPAWRTTPCYHYYRGKDGCLDGEICSFYHEDIPQGEAAARKHALHLQVFDRKDAAKREKTLRQEDSTLMEIDEEVVEVERRAPASRRRVEQIPPIAHRKPDQSVLVAGSAGIGDRGRLRGPRTPPGSPREERRSRSRRAQTPGRKPPSPERRREPSTERRRQTSPERPRRSPERKYRYRERSERRYSSPVRTYTPERNHQEGARRKEEGNRDEKGERSKSTGRNERRRYEETDRNERRGEERGRSRDKERRDRSREYSGNGREEVGAARLPPHQGYQGRKTIRGQVEEMDQIQRARGESGRTEYRRQEDRWSRNTKQERMPRGRRN